MFYNLVVSLRLQDYYRVILYKILFHIKSFQICLCHFHFRKHNSQRTLCVQVPGLEVQYL
ncbi:Uncharacterised protein [Klebsiella pneumoniae]|nr:Uncharacterised protein [Klebsiella pneumoniae]VCY65249.1 hypothetical protein BANRA_01522 [Klebsiella pneumoniae]